MTKPFFAAVCSTAIVLYSLGVGSAFAQFSPPSAQSGQQEEPLQMVIDYGQGKETRRESHHGVMEPVGLPAGQQVAITLQFLRKRAGDVVLVSPLDGGRIDLHGPATIAANGTLAFRFVLGRTAGLYRLTINGTRQYQLSLYAVDPNRLTRPARGPGSH